jgi:hypothetical protein
MARPLTSANDNGAIFREAVNPFVRDKARKEHKHHTKVISYGDESAAPHIGPIKEYDPSMYSDPPKRVAAAPDDPESLLEQLKQGGFTLPDVTGHLPTKGYMVSRWGREMKKPISQMTPQDIVDFRAHNANFFNQPGHHFGSWLQRHGNEMYGYLDVSRHLPQITPAIESAVHNGQLGIYDLGQNVSVMPPGGTWLQGKYNGGRERTRSSSAGGQWVAARSRVASVLPLPVSGVWTRHPIQAVADQLRVSGTGTPGLVQRLRVITALAAPHPDPATLQLVKSGVGTHGGELHKDPNGNQWLIKKSHGPQDAFMPDLDVGVNQIAMNSGLETPETFLTKVGGQKASAQLWYPGSKMAFGSKSVDPESLNDTDLLEIQKHHALDWLTGNHDSHGGQFLRDAQGHLVGIDKGQGFRFFNSDRLHWNYHPNGFYPGEAEPIYNTLYRNFAKGGRQIFDPREGELGKYIQGLQDMPDDEYRATLAPYAQGAAKAAMLGAPGGGGAVAKYSGHTKPRFPSNDSEAFLQAAVDRKNNLANDFGELYDRAMAHRMMGMKIASMARLAALPDPQTMWDMHQTVGSHGSTLWGDPQGEWVIKKPNPGNEFLVPLDKATADLQRMSGLESPETYAMPFQGGMATAVKMYPNSTLRWKNRSGPHLDQLSPEEQLTLQKHHALDWLIANHDAHIGNWLQTDNGLVGIDKGQALKYLGGDALDYKFHPNYYAKPPVYNRLWSDFAHGRGQMMDPREGELGQFVQGLQDIPDWKVRQMFAPYAWAAANAGMLATGAYGHGGFGGGHASDPHRGLHPSTIPPNDPGAFLDALVDRKNHLADDLGAYYDKSAVEREYNLAHPAPSRPAKPKFTPSKGWYPDWTTSKPKSKSYTQGKGYPWAKKPAPKPKPSPQEQMAAAEDAWDWG